jgi:type IV secretory pathway TrbD component
MELTRLFLFLLSSFISIDILVWLAQKVGVTTWRTMSQHLIATAHADPLFGLLLLALILTAAVWFIFHLELGEWR